MTDHKKIGLFLTHKDESQQAWVASASGECSRAGHELIAFWAEEGASQQSRQIADAIWQDRADALLILPASLGGPAALTTQALSHGKAVVLLNRTANDLNPAVSWSLPRLRQDHPKILAARVAPDEVAIGRLEAQQIRALLPQGGSVLYVQGDTLTSAAIDRTIGLEELLSGDSLLTVSRVDGGWRSDRAEDAVSRWARLVLADSSAPLDLVVSQSEVMLAGIKRALESISVELERPALATIPLTGCDGHPHFKAEIDAGRLAATIEIPDRILPAVQLCVEYWRSGTVPSNPEVKLPPASYPSLPDLAQHPISAAA